MGLVRVSTLGAFKKSSKFFHVLFRSLRFAEKLLFLLPTHFHGAFRSMCLEVLSPQADLRPQFYMELKDKGFHEMLTHRWHTALSSWLFSPCTVHTRVTSCTLSHNLHAAPTLKLDRDEPTQLAALEIVKRLSQHHHLDTKQTAALVPMITGFGSHSSEQCRQLMYEILVIIYNNIK